MLPALKLRVFVALGNWASWLVVCSALVLRVCLYK